MPIFRPNHQCTNELATWWWKNSVVSTANSVAATVAGVAIAIIIRNCSALIFWRSSGSNSRKELGMDLRFIALQLTTNNGIYEKRPTAAHSKIHSDKYS